MDEIDHGIFRVMWQCQRVLQLPLDHAGLNSGNRATAEQEGEADTAHIAVSQLVAIRCFVTVSFVALVWLISEMQCSLRVVA